MTFLETLKVEDFEGDENDVLTKITQVVDSFKDVMPPKLSKKLLPPT